GSYSQTNTQVSGVDEADTVKTDGKYIYSINDQGYVNIVSVDAEGYLDIVKQIKEFGQNFYPSELYVDDSFLIIIGSSYNDDGSYSTAYIYDKSNVQELVLLKDVMIKGYYSDSRKIDNSLYLICNFTPYYYYQKDTDLLPCYIEDGKTTYQTPSDIYYFEQADYSSYLILGGIDLKDLSKDVNLNTYLGGGQTVYMSNENLYVTYTQYQYRTMGIMSDESASYQQDTVVHKFSAENAVLNYAATVKLSGYPINQFAMDEYKGFFRIAVTDDSNGESVNNVYVFDENLIQTGSILNMAPGERIYSVRFNGDIGYMVTFVTVDPLFVMDLSDPYSPKIDGELKIPGYSTYMHMYSDTLILGFGMDTTEDNGRALNQGIKIAMFDVSDRTNPKQLFATSIGGRGTWSELNYNHKAFMFDRERNIFAFPASISGNNYEMKAQGLVVCRIDMENSQFEVLDILSQDYFTNWSNYVQRGLYIDKVLLTISSNAIYSYNYDTLQIIDNVIFD
ncbi:MAG: beta-propeller domain-containing protein, partial [Clostridia bacterium]